MKLTRKLFVISFVLVFAVLSISMVGYGADDLIVLHTNDIHGRIEADDGLMGYPYIASVIEDYRENYENVLVLDAGDAIHGRAITNELEGRSAV
ncbi:MAG: metallophosphoesterase, partial [Halarsenatibacteraceae bacterium]